MTGGRVVILGPVGKNFAAGMSGGIAYAYDEKGHFKDRCNMEMVELERVFEEDMLTIKGLLESHYKYTQSPVAKAILDDFKNRAKMFVKVMPFEYKRVLEGKKAAKAAEFTEVSDG